MDELRDWTIGYHVVRSAIHTVAYKVVYWIVLISYHMNRIHSWDYKVNDSITFYNFQD